MKRIAFMLATFASGIAGGVAIYMYSIQDYTWCAWFVFLAFVNFFLANSLRTLLYERPVSAKK